MKILSYLKKIPPSRFSLINLGCARNLVDSQHILSKVESCGHQWVDISKSDSVIINTCAFIDQAKQETIDTILSFVDLKKRGKIRRVVVLGCFSQRYPKELAKEFEEIDFIDGVMSLNKKSPSPSVLLTPHSFAYVKICESCYHKCSFCVIPRLKGPFASRYMHSILEEVRHLDQKKIKEIDIIGQDITAYGLDIYKKPYLTVLLKKIIKETKNIRWIRLLYLFPSHINDVFLDFVRSEQKICRYLDLPLQHINNRILKSMNRKMLSSNTKDLIMKIRKKIPDVCLRTSFIVGYPGETDQEFKELCDFVGDFDFEKVGVFMYSQQDGTPADHMPNQVPENIKEQRYSHLMKIQQKISKKNLKKSLGKTVRVLIDAKQKNKKNFYIGRREQDAPEVDGIVFVRSEKNLKSGAFIHAKIVASTEYDLVAQFIGTDNEFTQ